MLKPTVALVSHCVCCTYYPGGFHDVFLGDQTHSYCAGPLMELWDNCGVPTPGSSSKPHGQGCTMTSSQVLIRVSDSGSDKAVNFPQKVSMVCQGKDFTSLNILRAVRLPLAGQGNVCFYNNFSRSGDWKDKNPQNILNTHLKLLITRKDTLAEGASQRRKTPGTARALRSSCTPLSWGGLRWRAGLCYSVLTSFTSYHFLKCSLT